MIICLIAVVAISAAPASEGVFDTNLNAQPQDNQDTLLLLKLKLKKLLFLG
jgi:hypothetical protein